MEAQAVVNVSARASFKGLSSSQSDHQNTSAKFQSLPHCLDKTVMCRAARRLSSIRCQAARDEKSGVKEEPWQRVRPIGGGSNVNSPIAAGRKGTSGSRSVGNKATLTCFQEVLAPDYTVFDSLVDTFSTDLDNRIQCLERQFAQWEAVTKETMDMLTVVRKRCAAQKTESRGLNFGVELKADTNRAAQQTSGGVPEHGVKIPDGATSAELQHYQMNAIKRGAEDKVDEVTIHTNSLASKLQSVAKSVTKRVTAKPKSSIPDNLAAVTLTPRPMRRARVRPAEDAASDSSACGAQKKGKLNWVDDELIWAKNT